MSTGVIPYRIGTFSTLEEATAHWWPLLQELGWNRTKDDTVGHFHATQDGKTWLYIAPDATGRPEGSVMANVYPNGIGWVASFIMNAAFRRKSLGRELWKEMEITFRQNATTLIGLDAVPEQVETYKRRGFEGVGKIPLMTRKSLHDEPAIAAVDREDAVELQDLRDVDPEELRRVDLEHTGFDREAYWVTSGQSNRKDSSGFAIVKDGRPTGFVLIRHCEHGHRVGPLFAETSAQAKQLLHKAMNSYPKSEAYHVEIFGSNPDGVRVFEELGWKYAGLTYHRMWLHGRVPEPQMENGKGSKCMYAIFDAACG